MTHNPYAPPKASCEPEASVSLAPLGLVALSVPASVCFAGWSVDAALRYSTGGFQASLAALALVSGSFASIVPVVVLIGRLTKNPSERKWRGYFVLSVSLLALLPGLLIAAVGVGVATVAVASGWLIWHSQIERLWLTRIAGAVFSLPAIGFFVSAWQEHALVQVGFGIVTLAVGLACISIRPTVDGRLEYGLFRRRR